MLPEGQMSLWRQPEGWHFEFVSSETVPELWTKRYREWYFSLGNRLARGGRCKRRADMNIIIRPTPPPPPPNKTTKPNHKSKKTVRKTGLAGFALFCLWQHKTESKNVM